LLALRNDGPYATVIADMQMPGMDGAQFLGRARNLVLNAMRVLIAEKMDIVCLVNAVNDGCIFRLLVKSRQPAELKGAVIAALDRYRGRKEERVRIALPAHFSYSAPGERLQLAHTVDISSSGARLAGLQVQLEVGQVLKVECGAAGRRSGWYGWERTEPPWRATPDCSVLQACLAGDSP
jgi:DNA-binding NtrC family response regulator